MTNSINIPSNGSEFLINEKIKFYITYAVNLTKAFFATNDPIENGDGEEIQDDAVEQTEPEEVVIKETDEEWTKRLNEKYADYIPNPDWAG